MGIGRREFLRIFGATLVALAIPPTLAVAVLDDLYINRKLGLAFRRPAGWHFSDVQQMGEMLSGQILDLEDAGLVQKIKELTALPLVTLSQEPLTHALRHFTPGVNMYVDRSVPEDTESEAQTVLSPLESFEWDMKYQGKILKHFEVLSPLVATTVSECEAYEYSSAFLFEHANLAAPVRVRMRSVLIVQEPAWYTLRLHDSPYLGAQSTFDYSEFINSIWIV